MLPYQDSTSAAREHLKGFADIANPKDSILFFHQGLSTAKLNRNIEPRVDTADLKVAELFPDRYLFCIGGHIHMPQKLADNVYYVGSPFSMDWGESNQRKQYFLLDLE
jgi:DNA repair exonuclease SbcCD nuclease subunit